jgi:hypothetical protein
LALEHSITSHRTLSEGELRLRSAASAVVRVGTPTPLSQDSRIRFAASLDDRRRKLGLFLPCALALEADRVFGQNGVCPRFQRRKIDSHSTPITPSRGFLTTLQSCHSCRNLNYIAIDRQAHNPKVAGSNPAPATNSINYLHLASAFLAPQLLTFC